MTIRVVRQAKRVSHTLAHVTSQAWQRLRTAEGPLIERVAVPEGRVIDVPGRGQTFVVDVPGPDDDAPALLLFHSLGTTAHLTWFTAIGELSRQYRVIAFDQRWHGRGIRSDRFRLADCADDAAALLDVLDLDQAIVVGYSMGGALAQVFWRRHAERVSGLVLCSTAMRWTGNARERAFFRLLGAVNAVLRPTARERVHGLAAQLPHLPTPLGDNVRDWARRELSATSFWSLPEVLSELGRFDSAPWMSEVTVPTAVVVTARDRAIPPDRQRLMAATVPDAMIADAPGGHTSLAFDIDRWLPVFLDAVGAVAETAGRDRASAL